jgi:hypothetical protein
MQSLKTNDERVVCCVNVEFRKNRAKLLVICAMMRVEWDAESKRPMVNEWCDV